MAGVGTVVVVHHTGNANYFSRPSMTEGEYVAQRLTKVARSDRLWAGPDHGRCY